MHDKVKRPQSVSKIKISVNTLLVLSSVDLAAIRADFPDIKGTGVYPLSELTYGPAFAALVEDTTTTGSATREAAEAAIEGGLSIAQVIVMVDRSDGKAEANLSDFGVPYTALTVPADLGVEP